MPIRNERLATAYRTAMPLLLDLCRNTPFTEGNSVRDANDDLFLSTKWLFSNPMLHAHDDYGQALMQNVRALPEFAVYQDERGWILGARRNKVSLIMCIPRIASNNRLVD
jgi:hypothetical protein